MMDSSSTIVNMSGNIDNNSTEAGTYSSLYLTDISDISHIIVNDNQTYIILSDATPAPAPAETYKCPLCEYSTSSKLDFKRHLETNMGRKQCVIEETTSSATVTQPSTNNLGIISGLVQYAPQVTNSSNIHTESPVINIGIINDQSQNAPGPNTTKTEKSLENIGLRQEVVNSNQVVNFNQVTVPNTPKFEKSRENIGLRQEVVNSNQVVNFNQVTVPNTPKTEKSQENIGLRQEVVNSNQVNSEETINQYKCPLCNYCTFNKVNFKKHLVNNIGQNRTQCMPEPSDLTYPNDNTKIMKSVQGPSDQGNLIISGQQELRNNIDGNVKVKVGESVESEPVSSKYQTNINQRLIPRESSEPIGSEPISSQYHTNINQRIVPRESNEKQIHTTNINQKITSRDTNEEPVKHFKFSNIEQRKYKCSYCKKCFDQKIYLSQHLKTHSSGDPVNPFKCIPCDKYFYSEQYLTRHQRTCTMEKSNECS